MCFEGYVPLCLGSLSVCWSHLRKKHLISTLIVKWHYLSAQRPEGDRCFQVIRNSLCNAHRDETCFFVEGVVGVPLPLWSGFFLHRKRKNVFGEPPLYQSSRTFGRNTFYA